MTLFYLKIRNYSKQIGLKNNNLNPVSFVPYNPVVLGRLILREKVILYPTGRHMPAKAKKCLC